MRMLEQMMIQGALFILKVYRVVISPLYPPCCRFEPSCSRYAQEAIARHGLRGIFLTVRRLIRCHPFCKGGFDPVPELEEAPGKSKQKKAPQESSR